MNKVNETNTREGIEEEVNSETAEASEGSACSCCVGKAEEQK